MACSTRLKYRVKSGQVRLNRRLKLILLVFGGNELDLIMQCSLLVLLINSIMEEYSGEWQSQERKIEAPEMRSDRLVTVKKTEHVLEVR